MSDKCHNDAMMLGCDLSYSELPPPSRQSSEGELWVGCGAWTVRHPHFHLFIFAVGGSVQSPANCLSRI